jgi:hypothetical protein
LVYPSLHFSKQLTPAKAGSKRTYIMWTDFVKVYSKGDELVETCKSKLNSDGSFKLPWGAKTNPTIKAHDLYEAIIPHYEELTDEDLKEVYITLGRFLAEKNNYTACFLQDRAILVLYFNPQHRDFYTL